MSTVCFINPKKLLLGALVSTSLYTIHVQADNILSCDNEVTTITATTTHLTDNNNGTVTDPETGLIWKKCNEGQTFIPTLGGICAGGIGTLFTWQAALQRAQDVNAGAEGESFSQTDWRLPNIKELASIVELRCENPAINNTVFHNTPASSFWSSSPFAPGSSSAWGISFGNGSDNVSSKDLNGFVRLVRSGQ